MKDYERVLKYIKTNRRDMEDVTDENLARELYKFFYGETCYTCTHVEKSAVNEPCKSCNVLDYARSDHSEWSPK